MLFHFLCTYIIHKQDDHRLDREESRGGREERRKRGRQCSVGERHLTLTLLTVELS